ncbi:hypothetical protein [Streptomyces phaeoluteigriseus]
MSRVQNNRQGQHLGQWIDRVLADDLPTLHSFVTGLGQDLDAVVAGLSMDWDSGKPSIDNLMARWLVWCAVTGRK